MPEGKDGENLPVETNEIAKDQSCETINTTSNAISESIPLSMSQEVGEPRINDNWIPRTKTDQRGMKRGRTEVLGVDDATLQPRIVKFRRNAMTPNGAQAQIAMDVGILFQMETVCLQVSPSTTSSLDDSSLDDVDEKYQLSSHDDAS